MDYKEECEKQATNPSNIDQGVEQNEFVDPKDQHIQLIINFHEQQNLDGQKQILIQMLDPGFFNANSNLFIEPNEENQIFIIELLDLLFQEQPLIAYGYLIFEIISRCMHYDILDEILFSRNIFNLYDLLRPIMYTTEPETNRPIFNKENNFAPIFIKFLAEVSTLKQRPLKYDDILANWGRMIPFIIDCLNESDLLVFALQCIEKISLKNGKIRDIFIQHSLIEQFFKTMFNDEINLKFYLKTLSSLLVNNARDLPRLPQGWISTISEYLCETQADYIKPMLEFLISITSTYEGCRILKFAGIIQLMIDISESLPFNHRKLSLQVLMDMLDENSEPNLISFLIDSGSLNVFESFFETELDEVLIILLKPISRIIGQAAIEPGQEVPPLFEVFANSTDILDLIKEISDYDPSEHNSSMIEMAQFIITEMDGNFRKLENS